MKGNKNVKTLARKAITLQGKVVKAINAIRDGDHNLDAWIEAYTRLPAEAEEARAHAIDAQAIVDRALEELSKPLDEYRYDGGFYGYRRYSSPVAQAAWDATQQAEHSRDRLEILQREATKTLEEYTTPGREALSAAWDTWHEHNTLLTATIARIRCILNRDVIDLAELAKDPPKVKREETPGTLPDLSKVPEGNYAAAVDAKALYEAAKAVKQPEYKGLPILNYALVRVTDDGLKIITCALADNETGKKIKAESVRFYGNGERFETCVPAKPFTDWLRVMAEYKETLCLDFDPSVQILQIKAGNSRTEFKCLDAQEFPPC